VQIRRELLATSDALLKLLWLCDGTSIIICLADVDGGNILHLHRVNWRTLGKRLYPSHQCLYPKLGEMQQQYKSDDDRLHSLQTTSDTLPNLSWVCYVTATVCIIFVSMLMDTSR